MNDRSISATAQAQYGYGGRSKGLANEVRTLCTCIQQPKQYWTRVHVRAKCVPRMVYVFVLLKEQFLHRDKTLTSYMIDARIKTGFGEILQMNTTVQTTMKLNTIFSGTTNRT